MNRLYKNIHAWWGIKSTSDGCNLLSGCYRGWENSIKAYPRHILGVLAIGISTETLDRNFCIWPPVHFSLLMVCIILGSLIMDKNYCFHQLRDWYKMAEVPSSLEKQAASTIVCALWSKGLRGEAIASVLPDRLVRTVTKVQKELRMKSWEERGERIRKRQQLRSNIVARK